MRSCLLVFIPCLALFAGLASDAHSQGKKKPAPIAVSDQKDAFGDPLPVGAVARIGTTRYRLLDARGGPHGPVMSPDGKHLAALGIRDEVEIWRLADWTRERLISARSLDKKNPPMFQSVAFSSDGQKLVCFDVNQRIAYFLEAATGKMLKRLPLGKKDQVRNPHLMLTHDQKTLITAYLLEGGKNQKQEFQVWDLTTDKLKCSFDTPMDRFDGNINYAISMDGRWLAQGSSSESIRNRRFGGLDSFIEIWDLQTGKSARKIETDTMLRQLAFSPDGKWLAASNNQSVLRIYDAASGVEKHNIRLRRAAAHHLTFAPDGKSLFVAEFSGKITQWDHVAGEIKATYTPPANSYVRQLAFRPDGQIFALGLSGMDAISYWEVTQGKLFSPANLPTSVISGLQFSPKDELFVSSEDGVMAWWHPRTGAKLRDVKLEFSESNPLDFFPGDIVVNERFFREDRYLPRRGGGGGLVSLSAGADIIAVGGGGMYSFFEAKTGKLLYDEDGGRNGGPSSLAFLDDVHVASMQARTIRVWNAKSGRDVEKFELPLRDNEQSLRIAASPSGKQFVVATANDQGQGRTLLWDASVKRVLREWTTQDRQDALRFSPDQNWLALAGAPNRLLLIRAGSAKGDYPLQLGARTEEISELAFSPDGRQLACAGVVALRDYDSGKIFVVELASKKVRLELSGHPSGIIDRLAYSRDSGLLASGATDTTAVVWRAGLRGFADKPADREATPDELADWFAKMADANAKTAFQNMIKLAQTPAQAVKLLDAKIPAARKVDPGEKTVPQWIQDLGSGQYVARTRATEMLKKLGPSVAPDLQAALAKAPDIETKRRIEELLDRFASHEWTPEEVMHSRAVELLEAIGSAEARAVLTRWRGGDPGAILTREAAKALKQLAN